MLYKIIGADGKEYGPITAEVLRQWIAQVRANAQTRTLSENGTDWQPLGAMPEFAASFQPPVVAAAVQPRKTNGFALAGLIFGILSLLCCFKILTGALGITFSLIGLSQINRHPEVHEGRGLAIAGIALSVAGIVISLALIIFWLATGNVHFNSHWNFNQFGQ